MDAQTQLQQLSDNKNPITSAHWDRINNLNNLELRLDYEDNSEIELNLFQMPNLLFYNPHNYIIMEGDDVSYGIQGVTFRYTWTQWTAPIRWDELVMHGWQIFLTEPLTPIMERSYTNNLTDLSQQISASAKDRNIMPALALDDKPNRLILLAKLMRVILELAEAGEEIMNGDFDKFAEELGDAIIVKLGIAGDLGIPIGRIVQEKMKLNDTKSAFEADEFNL